MNPVFSNIFSGNRYSTVSSVHTKLPPGSYPDTVRASLNRQPGLMYRASRSCPPEEE